MKIKCKIEITSRDHGYATDEIFYQKIKESKNNLRPCGLYHGWISKLWCAKKCANAIEVFWEDGELEKYQDCNDFR